MSTERSMAPQTGTTASLGATGGATVRHLSPTYTVVAMLPEVRGAAASLSALEAVATLLPAATISVIHIEVDPGQLIDDDEEIAVQRLREAREGTSGERAVTIKNIFDAWVARAGAIRERVTWQKIVGGEERTAVRVLRDVDLVILARPQNLDACDALHAVLFSHHLVLVVPPDGRWLPGPFAYHIAVGWKPTKLVDGALLLALPFLCSAHRVSLLSIDQAPNDFSHDHVLRVIEQMGVRPDLHLLNSAARPIGHVLVEEAQRIGADVLLMGAYRHGEFVEGLFGGVTRDVIHSATMPVFMAH